MDALAYRASLDESYCGGRHLCLIRSDLLHYSSGNLFQPRHTTYIHTYTYIHTFILCTLPKVIYPRFILYSVIVEGVG